MILAILRFLSKVFLAILFLISIFAFYKHAKEYINEGKVTFENKNLIIDNTKAFIILITLDLLFSIILLVLFMMVF